MRTSALTSLIGILGYALRVGVPLVGLVFIALRVEGRAKLLGVAGAGVIALAGLMQVVQNLVIARLVRSTGYWVLSVLGLGLTLVTVAGIGLLVAAVCVGRPAKQPSPPAGPYGSFSPPPTA